MKPGFPNLWVTLFVLGVLLLTSFVLGFAFSEYQWFGSYSLRQLLNGDDSARPARVISHTTVPSILTDLNITSVPVPVNREGDGGGLTTFHGEVVLITHEGRIFIVDETGYEETAIVPPENGFLAYQAAAATEKYQAMWHDFTVFRYNDILHYAAGGRDYLVVSYLEWREQEQCYNTAIARLELPPGTLSLDGLVAGAGDWRRIYRTRPCLELKSISRAISGHIGGGRIAWKSEHRIILASGDYSWDGVYAPRALPQLADNDYGKVLEIDLSTGAYHALSMGHRNPQGVVVDNGGRIWVVEQGPRGGDELNQVIPGNNYGWPLETLGTSYLKKPWPMAENYGRHDRFTAPHHAWLPSVAISGITQVWGFFPAWDGDLLVASLKGQKLFRIRIQQDRVVVAEPIEIGERVRYVQQNTNGQLLAWTDDKFVKFITAVGVNDIEKQIDGFLLASTLDPQQQQSFRTHLEQCMQCHALNHYDATHAPPLGQVMQRPIATTDYAGYSPGLLAVSGNWSRQRMLAFLRDPQAFASGTRMPDPMITDDVVAGNIVSFLELLSVPE